MSDWILPHRSSSRLIGGARPGDLLLAPGWAEPRCHAGVSVVRREELTSPDELVRLADAVEGLIREWFGRCEREGIAVSGLPLAEAVGGALMPRLLQAAKAGLLLARLSRSHAAPGRIRAAGGWTGLRDALPAQDPPAPVAWEADASRRPILRAGPGLWWEWLAARRRHRARKAPERTAAGATIDPGSVWGMVTYRTESLFEHLERAGRPVRRFFRREENRYLPGRVEAAAPESWRLPWTEAIELIPEPEPSWDFDLRGVIAATLGPAGLEQAGPFLGQYRSWGRLIDRTRPRAVLAPPPWSGDLRALAFACRSASVPYVTLQDGVMSPLSHGGLLPPGKALVWSGAGRRWFEARGFSPGQLAETGEPYLERWLEAVEAHRNRGGARAGEKVLLGVLQNSSPHLPAFEEDESLVTMERIARAVESIPGWTLVIKPHPRLLLVDGAARWAEGALAARRHGARMVSPFADTAALIARADAYLSEGDTLTIEALAAGVPAMIWHDPSRVAPYEDLLGGGLPVVSSSEQLAAALGGGLDTSGASRLLRDHIEGGDDPGAALERWLN